MKRFYRWLVLILVFVNCAPRYIPVYQVVNLSRTNFPQNSVLEIKIKYLESDTLNQYQNTGNLNGASSNLFQREPNLSIFSINVSNRVTNNFVIPIEQISLHTCKKTNIPYDSLSFERRFPNSDYSSEKYYSFLFYFDGIKRKKVEQNISLSNGQALSFFVMFDSISEDCRKFSINIPIQMVSINLKQINKNHEEIFIFSNYISRRLLK